MVIRYVMAEYHHETYMEEDTDGNYVLHSDYAALEARVAELERDAERYRWLSLAVYGDKALADSFVDASMSREA